MMSDVENVRFLMGSKYADIPHIACSAMQANPSLRERITILYTQDGMWEVCLSGEFLFRTDSTKDLLSGLKKLFKILE